MPFFKQIQTEYGWIGTWKLEENPKELLTQIQLPNEDDLRFAAMRSEKRKVEFLAARMLLKMAFGEIPEIEYNGFGKPHLKNSYKKISISHSADFACVFVSNNRIGIDIERADRNIDRVADRFLHAIEKTTISVFEDQQLAKVAYWSAKEAIFKCADEHGIHFNSQIRIDDFVPENGRPFKGKLIQQSSNISFKMYFHFIENNVLVYAVEI
ncbi:4'-phosphopantetheinyl transferase family protein [Maribellus sediminis]|uniref:4'-phosphopantetheinyl transferase family protein n=1 Tax=Maribellus sediminis TaxID=2696285 RepID=UPI0014301872|nr:4'-phosphopantetheinyl transferase superfamily protein [Maribellus sediminis]